MICEMEWPLSLTNEFYWRTKHMDCSILDDGCVFNVKNTIANGLLLFINPYWMVIGVVYDNVHRFYDWKMAWMPQI